MLNEASDEYKKKLAEVKGLFGKKLSVKITDGRIFNGIFRCLDFKMDILLINAEEASCIHGRIIKKHIGLVNIPGCNITEILLTEL